MLIIFAFKEWPVLRELEYLRGYAAYTGLPGYAPIPPDPGPGGQLPGRGPRPWDYPHPDQP
ncbi:MAG: hypothetical protein ACXVYC_14685 [Blastococcus sp.]